jgi:NADPH2:quinone reductase
MRAVRCHQFGEPSALVLEEVEPPALTAGKIRIEVIAASICFFDLLCMRGRAQLGFPFPYVPGAEVAGKILEIAPDVTGFEVGQRVMAMTGGQGGYCEETVVPANRTYPIPESMSFEVAASFPNTYFTAHSSLFFRGKLQRGETLLVLGAAGGVGLAVVEIGAAHGAHVIAAASTQEKLEIVAAHGARDLVNYTTEDMRARVKAITGGKGVSIAVDPVGGDLFAVTLRCLAELGRVVLVGFTSGVHQRIPAEYLLVKALTVLGDCGEHLQSPDTQAASFRDIITLYELGRLKPHVSHVLPLTDYREAIRIVDQREATGKLVLSTA